MNMEQTNHQRTNMLERPNIYSEWQVRNKKIISIIVVATIIVAIAVVVGLVIGLSNNDIIDGNSDQEIDPVTFCDRNQDCTGVREDVKNGILAKFNKSNEVKSLMQISRVMGKIQANATTQSDYQKIYRQLLRSVECAQFIFGSNYSESFNYVEQLQLNNDQRLQNYLKMTESMMGQQIRLTEPNNILSTCNFTVGSQLAFLKTAENKKILKSEAENCTKVYSVLMYINGVGYTADGATQSIRKIIDITNQRESTKFDGGVIFSSAWRRERGLFIDIVEAYQQKLIENGQTGISRSRLLLFVKFILKSFVPFPFRTLTIFNDFTSFFFQKYAEDMMNIDLNYNVVQHTQAIQQNVREGRKSIIVAHSQGTLYANSVYSTIQSSYKDKVKMIFIGAAANNIGDNSGRYFTNPDDWVIDTLRTVSVIDNIQSPMPANVQAKSFQFFNHGVIGYLQSYTKYFLSLVQSAKTEAVQPSSSLGDGPITVELTWGNEPDVDLHVFQPSGKHVYYRQMTGDVGRIDLDDVDGHGPQHYFTKCNMIQSGTYKIRLNYYSGFSSTQANIRVKAGSQFITKTISLSNPMRSQGDSNPPYFVCDIQVTKNSQTNYFTYSIKEND